MRTPYRKSHGKITFVLYTRPSPCRGACLFCFSVKGMTKSTTQNEDTLLAKNNNWIGKTQLSERFRKYNLIKKSGLKCDLAIKGDSFGCQDFDYLINYFKELYDYLNDDISDTLLQAQEKQLKAPGRCVTIKVETRPDIISDSICKFFVKLGITTVELGVQSLNDAILRYNKRYHNVQTVVNATELLRKYGFEICYQVMVGLPGSKIEDDEELLSKKLWEEQFCPDAIKLYPCILLKASVADQKNLRKEYNSGRWNPINFQNYTELLIKCYPMFPNYVHVNRIQRIIEENKIEVGVAKEINRDMFSQISKCLWQKSIAQKVNSFALKFADYKIVYYKQGNNRYSFEAIYEKDIVIGYARFDIINEKIGIIRDIRVLGNMLTIGQKNHQDNMECQHIGIGKSLIRNIESKAVTKLIDFIVVKPSFGSKIWFLQQDFFEINCYYLVKPLKNNHLNMDEPNFIIRDEFEKLDTKTYTHFV